MRELLALYLSERKNYILPTPLAGIVNIGINDVYAGKLKQNGTVDPQVFREGIRNIYNKVAGRRASFDKEVVEKYGEGMTKYLDNLYKYARTSSNGEEEEPTKETLQLDKEKIINSIDEAGIRDRMAILGIKDKEIENDHLANAIWEIGAWTREHPWKTAIIIVVIILVGMLRP